MRSSSSFVGQAEGGGPDCHMPATVRLASASRDLNIRGDRADAEKTGPDPADRGKAGTKRHTVSDGSGSPLGLVVTGARVRDSRVLTDRFEARALPTEQLAPDPRAPLRAAEPHPALARRSVDRGYRGTPCADLAAEHEVLIHVAPPGQIGGGEPPDGDPGRQPARRPVIGPAHSRFNRVRRLLTRWEKRAAYLGFCCLTAVLITYKKVGRRRDPTLSG